jgi:hypothetical protein
LKKFTVTPTYNRLKFHELNPYVISAFSFPEPLHPTSTRPYGNPPPRRKFSRDWDGEEPLPNNSGTISIAKRQFTSVDL